MCRPRSTLFSRVDGRVGQVASPVRVVGSRLGAQAREVRRLRASHNPLQRHQPGREDHLHAPTLGVVCHSLMEFGQHNNDDDDDETVCGCVGDYGSVLVVSSSNSWHSENSPWSVSIRRGYCADAGTSVTEGVGRFIGVVRNPFKCNRKWIVGIAGGVILLCRVPRVGSCNDAQQQEVVEMKCPRHGGPTVFLQFSPLCDYVVLLREIGDKMETALFVDLESSFRSKELAITSRVVCSVGGRVITEGFMWSPDGTVCTLQWHIGREISSLVEFGTSLEMWQFPGKTRVVAMSKSHVFCCSSVGSEMENFLVYHTEKLATPSLCVACTWSFPDRQSGLILSTSHIDSSTVTQVQFSLHDALTGFYVGDFTVPVSHPFYFHVFY
ncbi:hypothetical protein Pelo_388 [Pelomyxa schiedti]|nr:hypothetical protein Pelo_388 [Pelomyxa schiedti]